MHVEEHPADLGRAEPVDQRRPVPLEVGQASIHGQRWPVSWGTYQSAKRSTSTAKASAV